MNDDLNSWVSLPLQGEAIRRVLFSGNGKDAEVCIETLAGERVVVPTEDLELSLAPGMTVRLRSLDDLNLAQEVHWPATSVCILENARVRWWLPSEEWSKELARRGTAERWELSCVVPVQLDLALRLL
jgi:hypothetical protein